MSNETKQDVFEEMKWELIRNLANTIDQNGGLRPLEDATKAGENYATRYADALPDNLPVIPEVVGEYIKNLREYHCDLVDLFGMVRNLGVTRTEPTGPLVWVAHNTDTFARAWLLGVWRVEETGEIVKLEDEK